MILIRKGATALDDILASGYSVAENTPVVAQEITTAAGYPRRSYLPNGVTVITLTLCNQNSTDLSAYLQLFADHTGTFTYWSPAQQTYKQAEFYIDVSAAIAVATAEGESTETVWEEYTVTLTQKGAATVV